MKKLTKGYEASAEQAILIVSGHVYKVANLRKSGITHQGVILIGDGEKWQEINCHELGISTDINRFVYAVSTGSIMVPGITSIQKTETHDYRLTHADFESLENDFPAYPYYMISLLYRHMARYKPAPLSDLKQLMRRVSESGKTIPEWIKDSENRNVMFVEQVPKGGNYEYSIIAGLQIITLCIRQYDNMFSCYITTNLNDSTGISAITPAYSYETIKKSEQEGLSNILYILKNRITTSENPEHYYEIFKLVQNKYKTINMNETTKTREQQLASLGMTYVPANDEFIGHGFTVTGNSLENDSEEEWQNTFDRISQHVSAGPPPILPAPGQPSGIRPALEYAAPQNGGKTDERIKQLIEKGLKFDGDRAFELHIGKTGYINVDYLDIQTYSDRKWTGLMIDIDKMLKGKPTETSTESPAPAPESNVTAPPPPTVSATGEPVNEPIPVEPIAETPGKKPVSIAVIGALESSSIKEFKALEAETDKLIKANPIVEIKDAKTLEKAKKHRAAMLKACTSIDGKEGLAAITNKAFNTVKKTLSDYLGGVSKKRREHYNLLDEAVVAYENAEALRKAEEDRLRLQKIKDRTDRLFAIPMVFNGTSYNIGTVYILGSQIESLPDAEFDALVDTAVAVKQLMDAEAEAQRAEIEAAKAKDAEIEAMRKRIAELEGREYVPANAEPAAPTAPPMDSYTTAPVTVTDTEMAAAQTQSPMPPITAPPVTPSMPSTGYVYPAEYNKPSAQNYLLAKFDMETDNLRAVSMNPVPAGFIQVRGYYVRGMKDLANAVNDILIAPQDPANPKSVQIAELCQVILNQK